MIKWAKIGLLSFLAIFLVLLCFSDNYKDKPIEEIEKSMLQTRNITSLKKATENDLRRYYGISPQDYDGCFLYLSSSNMAVEELLIVKMKDSSQESALENQVQKRLDAQIDAFDGYGVEQTAMLKSHVLECRGNYLFFGVSKEVELWKTKFLSCIKK